MIPGNIISQLYSLGRPPEKRKRVQILKKRAFFTKNTLSALLVFDHALILKDYYYSRAGLGQLKL